MCAVSVVCVVIYPILYVIDPKVIFSPPLGVECTSSEV